MPNLYACVSLLWLKSQAPMPHPYLVGAAVVWSLAHLPAIWGPPEELDWDRLVREALEGAFAAGAAAAFLEEFQGLGDTWWERVQRFFDLDWQPSSLPSWISGFSPRPQPVEMAAAAGRGVGIATHLGPGIFLLVHHGAEWDECLALAPIANTESWVCRTTTEDGQRFVMVVVTPKFGECAFPIQSAAAGMFRDAPGHLDANLVNWVCQPPA